MADNIEKQTYDGAVPSVAPESLAPTMEASGGSALPPSSDPPRVQTAGSNRLSRVNLVILILLAVMVAMLASCGGDTEESEPVPPENPAVTREIVTEPASLEDFAITSEVIISGSEADIKEIVDGFDGISIQPGPKIEIGLARNDPNLVCPGVFGEPSISEDFVYALYSFTETEDWTVASIIDQIESLASENQKEVTVEANRIAGKPWEIEGGPWEIEGGPWEIEGGPWEIEGGSGAGTGASIEPEGLDRQRALSDISYYLPDEAAVSTPVQIAVFDTSPFDVALGTTETRAIPWVTWPDQLSLSVSSAVEAGSLEPGEPDLSDHGLSVAGLIHMVAPNSSISLIRVLEDDNTGDLFVLSQELFDFIDGIEAGEKAVINLSLAVRIPQETQLPPEELPVNFRALQEILALAECKGIVVVAAAGNGSFDREQPLGASVPASLGTVISVASSDNTNHRACYSNMGDIAAPGGNGRDNAGDECRPYLSDCTGPKCKYGVIGPVLKADDASSGYAYWVGSSFATPLVSGLVARILEEADTPLAAHEVREILMCGVRDGAGNTDTDASVIDVEDTLSRPCNNMFSASAN